jgi:carboxypeptidase C (cathepsin A)
MSQWLCLFLFISATLVAEEEKQNSFQEQSVETEHVLTLNGIPLKYKATAGSHVIKGEKEKKDASLFYIFYEKQGDETQRPITFCFNGGPGSSSVWLHLGAFGPKKIVVTPPGIPVFPAKLEDNLHTILDLTDLVFIDPVSTGYSEATDPQPFWDVNKDIETMAEFIRLFVTKNNRWESAKYLCGESYGTFRAVGVADLLFRQSRMDLAGILLISSVLDFSLIDFFDVSDLGYALTLPTMTATAWYYKKLQTPLQNLSLNEVLKQAEKYAVTDYTLALMEGNRLSADKQKGVAKQLSLLTGLKESTILQADLRVATSSFVQELLKEEGLVAGRLDSRFTTPTAGKCQDGSGFDPSLQGVIAGFQAAMQDYLRNDLKVTDNRPYELLKSLGGRWNFGNTRSLQEEAKLLLLRQPQLKFFVASGYFDFATPYFSSHYFFSHIGLPPSSRVVETYYDSGHMMYLDAPSLQKLKQDVSKFYQLAK